MIIRMAIWMCNVRSEDRICAEELRNRLKLKSIRECLQDRRQQCFGDLERIEETTWSSKCTTSKVSRRFFRGRPRKIWNE